MITTKWSKKSITPPFEILKSFELLTIINHLVILKIFLKSIMLQDRIWNAHCSRSMLAISSWTSVLFKYGPGAYLTLKKFFMIINGPGPYKGPNGPGPLDHKSRTKSLKSLRHNNAKSIQNRSTVTNLVTGGGPDTIA